MTTAQVDRRTDTSVPEEGPEGVPYRLTAGEYYRMVDEGIIPEDRRVGLWEGQLFAKMAKELPHSVTTAKWNIALGRVLPPGWFLWLETPITLAEDRVLLPDGAVVRGDVDDYLARGRRPDASDVGLVVEVADTSMRKDTGRMLEGYARSFIPFYWVVNLVALRIEVYSRPAVRDGRALYEQAEIFGLNDSVSLILDGREVARIPAREILPARAAPEVPG